MILEKLEHLTAPKEQSNLCSIYMHFKFMEHFIFQLCSIVTDLFDSVAWSQVVELTWKTPSLHSAKLSIKNMKNMCCLLGILTKEFFLVRKPILK